MNLASGTLGEWGRTPKAKPSDLAALAETPLDDVLYFPPVPPRRAAARDEVARARLMAGTPVLVQLLPGEESTVPRVTGAAIVFDLLPALLDRDLGRLRRLPTGATAIFPLLPGVTDDPALWELACRDLAAAGVGLRAGAWPRPWSPPTGAGWPSGGARRRPSRPSSTASRRRSATSPAWLTAMAWSRSCPGRSPGRRCSAPATGASRASSRWPPSCGCGWAGRWTPGRRSITMPAGSTAAATI